MPSARLFALIGACFVSTAFAKGSPPVVDLEGANNRISPVAKVH